MQLFAPPVLVWLPDFRYNTPVVPDLQLKQSLSDRQLEIYTGRKLSVPVSFGALETEARQTLPSQSFDYVAGGAGAERTMQANLDAFYRWRIVPRLLRDVSQRDLAIDVLGMRLPAPVILGPVGVQGIIHASGELATAKAAASLGLPFVLSTVSSYSIEQVAAAMPGEPRWFQLYPSKDPQLNASLLRRAENAGYSAVVVTLDTRLLGWRERDLDRAYLPFLEGLGLANYFSDPVSVRTWPRLPKKTRAPLSDTGPPSTPTLAQPGRISARCIANRACQYC